MLRSNNAEPVTHSLAYSLDLLIGDCAHVADGVAKMDEQSRLMNETPVSYQVIKILLPVMFDYFQKLRQRHQSRLVPRPQRHPAFYLFRFFQLADFLLDICGYLVPPRSAVFGQDLNCQVAQIFLKNEKELVPKRGLVGPPNLGWHKCD